jgi:membrane associated rhomboid family serine protease
MIPIRDKNPSGVVPIVVYGLLAANVAAFLYELALPEEELKNAVMRFGIVPANVTAALKGDAKLLHSLLIPAVTSMFLHGGWLHLIGNMWYLFIFGDNVEGRLGHVTFLAFYVLCGFFASAAQCALDPSSTVPAVGASGALAGVLGAYLACWPRARVVTLVPLLYIITFVDLPAVFVLGFWFVIQLLEGVGSIGAAYASGGIAYWAHIGGFVSGLLLVRLLPARLPPEGRRSRTPRYRQ